MSRNEDRFVAIEHENGTLVHATAADGNYTTLCGASDDDDPETGRPAPLPARPRIDCPHCAAMILAGKTYSVRDLTAKARREAAANLVDQGRL